MKKLSLTSLMLAICIPYGCATKDNSPLPAAPMLNSSPDISEYTRVNLSASARVAAVELAASYNQSASQLEVRHPEGSRSGSLASQVTTCGNSSDPNCPRQFALIGELDAFSMRLRCFIEIRNDHNIGYIGQALQGSCTDQFNRNYAITISKG